jgi:hypothetical protein
MKHSTFIGRVGALSVALGLGAGLAAAPWAASANPDVQARIDAAKAERGNVSVSVNGKTLIQKGSALATSGVGNNRAIARGANTLAGAGTGTNNTAVAVGQNVQAAAGVGDRNFARVTGTNMSTAVAAVGNNNRAVVTGDSSAALAGLGNGNSATIRGNEGFAAVTGNQNTVVITGNESSSEVTGDRNEVRIDGNKLEGNIAGGNDNSLDMRGEDYSFTLPAGSNNINVRITSFP